MPMTDAAPSPMDVVTGLLRANTLPNPPPRPYVLRLRPRSPGERLSLFFFLLFSFVWFQRWVDRHGRLAGLLSKIIQRH